MIKDGKFVSTEFPQYETNWGMLDSEDKVKIKGWLTENITNLQDNISQVGYDESYDSAQCDNEGEGL